MPSIYKSAYPSMDRDTPEARARAATMAYDSSRGTYEDEVNRARMARDQAMGYSDRTRGDAERSIEDYAKGGATPLRSWSPTAMTAYAPTQMAQWMSSAGAGRALPARRATESRGIMVSPTGPSAGDGAYRSENLAGFDAERLVSPTGPSAGDGAYRPELTGWSPTATDRWMSGAGALRSLPTRGGGASAGRVVSPTGPSAGGAYKSENLAGFDVSTLENFDPSAAGKTFAGGAYGDFKRQLADELRDLTNRSVGAGRFNTGLFDEDQGGVVTDLGGMFEDKIAQQSGVFSGQRLDALRSGADLRYKRASDMDTNARSVYEQERELARRAAEQESADSIARDRLDLEGYGLETDRYRVGGGFAQSADEMAYKRASDMDRNAEARRAQGAELDYNRGRDRADLGFRRASEMDTNARMMAEVAARNAEARRAQGAELDYNRGRDEDRFGLDAYGLETDRYRVGGGFAQSADEMAYKRASDMDRMTYDQARDLTDVGEGRARTGLETSLGRERTYLDDYYRRSGDATSAASGQRDWAARDQELEELRAEIAAIRKASARPSDMSAGSRDPASNAPLHPNAALAKSQGVRYYG